MAQEITPAECAACQVDYDKYCRGTFPGRGRIIRRLAGYRDNTADGCKKVAKRTRNDPGDTRHVSLIAFGSFRSSNGCLSFARSRVDRSLPRP